jgi:hypothetical protein
MCLYFNRARNQDHVILVWCFYIPTRFCKLLIGTEAMDIDPSYFRHYSVKRCSVIACSFCEKVFKCARCLNTHVTEKHNVRNLMEVEVPSVEEERPSEELLGHVNLMNIEEVQLGDPIELDNQAQFDKEDQR